jgi:hypothetical protein
MSWRRLSWALPVVLFVATFGVFGVRHPGSVKAMLTNVQGVAMTLAAIAAGAIFVWATRFRPAIKPFVPFVFALGILGGAVYAEVPFERTSTQNRMLVSEPIADRAITAAPRMATRHSTGQLKGINHSASGDVSIIESSDGEFVVRFENFSVQGAPAPVLYLIEGEDKQNPGGTNLGAFTATDGKTLDVALPAGVEPGPGWTVLIWCEKFATPIANATQR